MNPYAFAFHAAEPGHLALGELMDRGRELGAHFVEGEFADDMLRHEFVLESIIYEVFGWNRLAH